MKTWLERISPEEGTLRPRTLAELYGAERVLVEQHRGILAYGDSCIHIGASFGILVVEGEGLRLCCMSSSQIVICGRIHALRAVEGS